MTATLDRPRAAAGPPASPPALARAHQLRRPGLPALLTLAALAVPILLGFLVYELWTGARLAIARFGLDFVTTSTWDPVAEQFGAFPLIFGTLVSSLIALAHRGAALARRRHLPDRVRPQGGAAAGRLPDRPPRRDSQRGLRPLGHLRADSRSSGPRVFPFLRDTLGFLPLFQGPIYGPSMLAAGIILAIMVMPYVMSVSREVLLAVPDTQREAALALGATRWEAVDHRHPALRPLRASSGAIILGLGRALGETMAVTMLIGNRHEIAASLFAPGYTMAAAIANEFSEAVGDLHLSALAYVAFLLFMVTVLVNAGARLLIWRVARGSGAGSRPCEPPRRFRRVLESAT